MATVFRPAIITKIWARDPNGVSVRSQNGTTGSPGVLTNLKSQDEFFGLAGHPNFDWPVTRGKLDLSNLGSSNPNLSIGGSAAPFAQDDWPNPRGSTPSILLRTWTDPLKLNLQGQDFLPFRQSDWPVPRGPARLLQTHVDQLKINLLVPFNQLDWPNPRGPTLSILLRTWIDTLKLNLQGQDFLPFRQLDWPNRYQKLVVEYGWIGQSNLNLNTVFTPFSQTDWPNPRGAVGSILLRTWTDPVKLNLQGQDFLPFRQSDWPNRYQKLAVEYGWTATVNPNLVTFATPFSQDDWPVVRGKPYGGLDWFHTNLSLGVTANNPFNQTDWPVPRGKLDLSSLAWYNPNIRTETAQPFAQTDWPNPRGAILGITLRTWIDPLKLNLQGQDFLPFRQRDWPLRYQKLSVEYGWASQSNPNLYTVFSPFNQEDWPNPSGARHLNQGWLDQLKLNLQGQDFLPFRQTDWPNPTRGKVPGQPWLNNVQFQLFTPFNQTDWPNPVRSKLEAKTWTNNVQFQLLTPFNQTDWPNPLGAIPSISLKTHTDALKINLLVPFDQTDWPNPRGTRHLNQGWLDPLKLNLQGQDALPFRQADWPVPPAPIASANARTWIDRLDLPLYFAGQTPPPTNYDWPNPRGPTPSILLKTWLDVYKLNLKDTFFGLAGNPNYDWPNPIRGKQRAGASLPTNPLLFPPPPVVAQDEWHWNPGAGHESGWGVGIGLGWAVGMGAGTGSE